MPLSTGTGMCMAPGSSSERRIAYTRRVVSTSPAGASSACSNSVAVRTSRRSMVHRRGMVPTCWWEVVGDSEAVRARCSSLEKRCCAASCRCSCRGLTGWPHASWHASASWNRRRVARSTRGRDAAGGRSSHDCSTVEVYENRCCAHTCSAGRVAARPAATCGASSSTSSSNRMVSPPMPLLMAGSCISTRLASSARAWLPLAAMLRAVATRSSHSQSDATVAASVSSLATAASSPASGCPSLGTVQ
mmetsp:Transcript_6409/g.12164  ORF Transcript_6409/g.12164 Transcript_6409/m.12164 type:complete len:247 (-) Transcript_6409:1812-2552(-)